MDNSSPPPAWWQMPAMILSFIGLYLLWAVGFDWLAREMSGGVIESALNWLSRVWFWGVLILFGVGVAVSAMTKRQVHIDKAEAPNLSEVDPPAAS